MTSESELEGCLIGRTCPIIGEEQWNEFQYHQHPTPVLWLNKSRCKGQRIPWHRNWHHFCDWGHSISALSSGSPSGIYSTCFLLRRLATECLITLPEFGTTKCRVYFYIPSKRWGVELLRDGNTVNADTVDFPACSHLTYPVTRPSKLYHCCKHPRRYA